MVISLQELESLVRKSAFLRERQGWRPAPDSAEETRSRAKLLAEWEKHVSPSEPQTFEKLLAWEGLSRADAATLVGAVASRSTEEMPPWAHHLQAVVEGFPGLPATLPRSRTLANGVVETVKARPFDQVLYPFTTYAIAQVTAEKPGMRQLLSDGAIHDLQDGLLQQLCDIAAQALQIEFLSFSAFSTAPSKFQAFVTELHQGAFTDFLQEYAVLARFLGEVVHLWIDATVHFLTHLEDDVAELALVMNGGVAPGKVVEVTCGLSDPHNGGRTVLGVSFEAGLRCFYKPKNIDSDRLYQNLLVLLERNSQVLPMLKMLLVTRPDHGWTSNIAVKALGDAPSVGRYFERMGTILFALYLLGGNDCNIENIIPCGEFPVMIDTETIFQSEPNPAEASLWGANSVAQQQMYFNSVLRVGMLPRWKAGPDGQKHDISSLGGYNGQRGSGTKRIWNDVNTDAMTSTFERVMVKSPLARLGEQFVSPVHYRQNLIDGFSRAYRAAERLRDSGEATVESILSPRSLPLRFLARNTYVYYALIEKMIAPANLRSGLKCSYQLESLRRNFLRSENRPHAWPLVNFEEAALAQMDIPRLAMRMDTTALYLGHEGEIPDYFARPDTENFVQRLAGLSDSNRLVQVAFIKATMSEEPRPEEQGETMAARDSAPLSADEAIQIAQTLARQISAAAIHGGDGTVTWVTFAYNPASQMTQFQPMGLRLYDGVAGTAIFLAAAANATGEQEFRDLAIAALKVTALKTPAHVRHWMQQDGIGAGLGAASFVYAQMIAGQLLNEPQMIKDGLELTRLFDREAIDRDVKLDLLGGTAGSALVASRLFEATGDAGMGELARYAADKLVAAMAANSSGLRGWPTLLGKHLSGYSHGAAGIVHALSRVYGLSGDERYRDAALAGVAYENTLFDTQAGNWVNLLEPRTDGSFGFWNTWCHGAAGIGLGRLRTLEQIDTPQLREDLRIALKAVEAAGLSKLDHPCCGNLGRVETLIEYSGFSGDDSYLEKARRVGQQVAERARSQGGYAVGQDSAICIPSFHQGLAGIGYQFLRLARPETYPSVLSCQ